MATDYNSWISQGGSPYDFWNQQSQGGSGAEVQTGPSLPGQTGPGVNNRMTPTASGPVTQYGVPSGSQYNFGGVGNAPTPPGSGVQQSNSYTQPGTMTSGPNPTTPNATYTNPTGAAPGTSSTPGTSGTPAASQYFPGSNIPTSNPFGSSPFLPNPTGTGPNGSYNFNQNYFPSQSTANTVAQMAGGQVVANPNGLLSAPGSPFTQNQTSYMVQLPNGTMINPGNIASYYQNYSDPSQANLLQQLVQGELTGQGQGNVGYNPALASNAVAIPPVANNPAWAQQQLTWNPFTQQPISGAPQSQSSGSQSTSQPTGPFDFGSLVSQLYGSNPFTAAANGNSTLGGLLQTLLGSGASSSSTDSMSSIASILNALYSQRTNVNNQSLSPLFWNSQQATPLSNYYPAFY